MSLIYLPFFAMHFCTYVIIGPEGAAASKVAEALAPFDDSLEVEPYKDYLAESEIKGMAKFCGVDKTDVATLIGKMPAWRSASGGQDEVGLFCWLTANPNGRWDWYKIGGRWNGVFGGENVMQAKTLLESSNLKDRLPAFLLTPDGVWYEVETIINAGDYQFSSVRKTNDRWLIEVKQVLARWPGHRVVCVDIHS
jgi:hypothetical protein